MKGKYLQRTEGNAWYNIITCAFLFGLVIVVYVVVGLWSPAVAPTVAGLSFIPLGIFYLWFIGWLMRGRWYLEYDENGLTYKAFFMKSYYPWKDVSCVRSTKSPEFMGKYHDILLLDVNGKAISFFLHDFGLVSKKPTVSFIENVVETWEHANPEAAARTKESRVAPSETDEQDVYDEEH